MRKDMKTFLADLESKVEHYSREYKLLSHAQWQDEHDTRDYMTLLQGELEIFTAHITNVDKEYDNNLAIFKATLNRE